MNKLIYSLHSTIDIFNKNCIDNPKLESELMISNIIKCKHRIDLYTKYHEKQLTKKQLNELEHYIQRRIEGEPIQYILNNASFYGHNFFVDNNVLIPRFDSELMIDILKNENQIKKLLEIGTGSGNLCITIAKENIADYIIATDISKDIINIAKHNKNKICPKSKIKFILDDLFNTKIDDKFDAIISNPPYIPKIEINNLDQLVKNNEPINALTDYNDGYNFYKQFALIGKNKLNQNGFMLLEIGIDNDLKKMREIFSNYKFKYFNDLNKIPRIIKIY